jgi:magnesium chelatase subunit D
MAPTFALLTDGRCNIARDGSPGRKAAEDDALAAARAFRAAGLAGLVVDVGSRPQPGLSSLAREMGARYLALPRAGADFLAHSLSAALPG